jgi:L-lactate dehydrogenase complex protein LldE
MVQHLNDKHGAPHVGLFVTCLANALRPSVGFSAIELLEQAGARVTVPENQTCCGQPGFNSGDFDNSRKIARQVIRTFEAFDYLVVPSGSCAGMIARHYPDDLFRQDPVWERRARRLAEKTYELTGFLTDVMDYSPPQPIHELGHLHVTYHDSCSCLRQMKIRQQPRQLLKRLCNIDVDEMADTDVCCGFGGSFSLKMPELSGAIADNKIENALATGAEVLVAADMGCLLHLAGRLRRRGEKLAVRHVAEVLCGRIDAAPIGAEET